MPKRYALLWIAMEESSAMPNSDNPSWGACTRPPPTIHNGPLSGESLGPSRIVMYSNPRPHMKDRDSFGVNLEGLGVGICADMVPRTGWIFVRRPGRNCDRWPLVAWITVDVLMTPRGVLTEAMPFGRGVIPRHGVDVSIRRLGLAESRLLKRPATRS